MVFVAQCVWPSLCVIRPNCAFCEIISEILILQQGFLSVPISSEPFLIFFFFLYCNIMPCGENYISTPLRTLLKVVAYSFFWKGLRTNSFTRRKYNWSPTLLHCQGLFFMLLILLVFYSVNYYQKTRFKKRTLDRKQQGLKNDFMFYIPMADGKKKQKNLQYISIGFEKRCSILINLLELCFKSQSFIFLQKD